MGTNVWCFVTSVLLLSVNAELHDDISQSFYETPQSSSPSPLPSLSPSLGSQGMKELVLFLTPDQAEMLRNAGALVKPFPEYNAEFVELQQQFQESLDQQNIDLQSIYQQNILQHQTPASYNQNENPELTNYFRLLNIQEINDDLALKLQVTEFPTETPATKTIKMATRITTSTSTTPSITTFTTTTPTTTTLITTTPTTRTSTKRTPTTTTSTTKIPTTTTPTTTSSITPPPTTTTYTTTKPTSTKPTTTKPTTTTFTTIAHTTTTPTPITSRYKYTKSRQQNKEKEYFIPYVPKKANRPKVTMQNSNSEYVRFLPNYENVNLKMMPYYALPLSPYKFENVGTKLYTQVNNKPQLIIRPPINEDAETNGEVQAYTYTKNRNETETSGQLQPIDMIQSSVQTQAIMEVPAPVLIQKPKVTQNHLQLQEPLNFKENQASIEDLPSTEEQQEKPETPKLVPHTVQTPFAKQDQVSRLLAPLYQHQTITETITKQREELLNSEFQIHSQLQEIKQSSTHNDQEYASVVEQLTNNLGKQNALSEIDAISKSPKVFINQQAIPENSPIGLQKQAAIPVPVLVRIPEPFERNLRTQQPLQFVRPIPVPLQHAGNVDLNKAVQVEAATRVPVIRHSYFRVNKPQVVVQRVIPFRVKHEFPVKMNIQKPEEITIIRPIWEH